MMKRVVKILLKVLLGVTALVLIFIAFVAFFPQKTYNIPVEDFEVSTDSVVLARGEYLIFGPAHCAECHTPKDTKMEDYNNRPPLSGGRIFESSFASISVKNLTPDPETGIGKLSNADIERTIRYGVNRHGYALMPFMRFTQMSKEDVRAIVSYLRAQPAVRNEIPETKYYLMGKGMMRFLIRPMESKSEIPEKVESNISVENGSYLVNDIGGCNGCHTPFDMSSMSWDKSKHLSGGNEMSSGDMAFLPPNLTPDKKTGHLVGWTEDRFVERFKTGRLLEKSPMPWEQVSEISEDDLRSMWRYLQTVTPIEHDNKPTVRLISESLEE